MTNSEKISIVLPTYNGSKLLRGSIDSCLGQTHKDLELIVVDDCSTDDTPQIVRSYNDPRLHYFRNEKNQRLPRSLNIGFSHATGQYLTWTSDDNEFYPDAIEKMLDSLKKNTRTDFVYADQWVYDEATGQTKLQELPETLSFKEKNVIGGCFMYTRRVYETIGGYNPYYEVAEDYDYWIRISRKFKSVHCPHAVYLYRFHSQAMTATRVHDVGLFDAILKYRNGFIPLSKLGWMSVYYFQNVGRTASSKDKRKDLIRHAFFKIRRLSFPFFIFFLLMLAFFYSLEMMRPFLSALGILKKKKLSDGVSAGDAR